MFENFWGNRAVTESLEQMIAGQRLSQTLLFSGREGVGKATLARRMAARLLGHAELIEKDDLALSAKSGYHCGAREVDRREAQRRSAPVRHASRFRHLRPRRSAAPDLDSADAPAEGSGAISAAQGRPARVPDRPRGPRQRPGGQLPAQDAGGTARSSDPDHDGRERVRSAAHHPLARGAVLLCAARAGGDARPSCGRARWINRSGGLRWRPAVRASPCRSTWRPTISAAPPCWRC